MLDQVLSITGALLVLGAYVANLLGRLDRDGARYAALNLLGSGMLSFAARHAAAGVLFIEVAWSVISLVALVAALRKRLRAGAKVAAEVSAAPPEGP